MTSTVRSRLGWSLIGFLLLGLICQVAGNYFAYTRFLPTDPAGGTASLVAPFMLLSAFTAVGTFCIALAVAMGLGIVASLVVEEAFERKLRIDAGIDDVEHADALADIGDATSPTDSG
jgi:hypothetical protein